MASRVEEWGNRLYTGEKNYNIIGKRRVFYTISIIVVVLCILAVLIRGFNLGIDFRGGSEFTVSNSAITAQQPAIDVIHNHDANATPLVSTVGSNSIRIQTSSITDADQVESIRKDLAKAYGVSADDVANTVIGPSWGTSVSVKALQGLVVFLIVVALFMTLYFRNWRMSASGILALFHDLIVTVGLYAAIGWEITPASMIGFLTILGYSMYDTVVVFDKVRENTKNYTEQTSNTYSELANLALNQTLVRSINTSVVGLLPVSAVLVVGTTMLGAGTLRDIALALFIGMITGVYSSIFIATPFDVTLMNLNKKTKKHNKAVADARTQMLSTVANSLDIPIEKLAYNDRGELCEKVDDKKLQVLDLKDKELVDEKGNIVSASVNRRAGQYLPGEHKRNVHRSAGSRSKRSKNSKKNK